MIRTERHYLPAAGHDWFLPLYDPLTRLLGVDTARAALVDQAEIQAHHRVLDIGCGTGALALLVARRVPGARISGFDPDPRALARARRKAARQGAPIRFDQGFADALPYPDASFDRVVSSMMLHHLEPESKPTALAEIHRVLAPGGRLELLDFASAADAGHGRLGRLFHSHHRLADNAEPRVLALIRDAGFAAVRTVERRRMLFGRVAFYRALRAG